MKVVCLDINSVPGGNPVDYPFISPTKEGLSIGNTYDAEQSGIMDKFYVVKGDNGRFINTSKSRFISLANFRENRLALLLDFD